MSLELPPAQLLGPLQAFYSHLWNRVELMARGDPSLWPTSWFRTEAHNASVGGHRDSQHLLGFAIDVTTERPDYVAEYCEALGLVPVVELDHVHIQIFPAGFLRSLGLFR
jgi:hypothetical protein